MNNLDLDFSTPQVMGILNVTPDSFYQGSRKQTESEISQRAVEILEEGGSMIDVGAFSTRPGAAQVSSEEEMRRMRFGLNAVRNVAPDALLSIDTFRPEVARMAVEEFGAAIINDVSEGGLTGVVDEELREEGCSAVDGIPAIFREVARLGVTYILMSVQSSMEETITHFDRHIEMLRGLGHEKIILDPGYGFGKPTVEANYAFLSRQMELKERYNLPLLVGVSRKRMIWQLLETTIEDSLIGTTAVNVMSLERGADILRVHDVKAAVQSIMIYNKFRSEIA